MQFLIKKTTHSTGEEFTDIVKAKDNETFTLVEAESGEQALQIAMGRIILRPVITKNYKPPEFDSEEREVSPSLTDEQVQKLIELPPRKDSE